MKTQQPVWKYLANLGDAHPLEHGGFFVYTDETGVYPPEAELLIPPPDEVDIESKKARWTVYRICLEPCTFQNGILSDNKFHPNLPAWFAKPESERTARPQDTTYLKDICVSSGIGEEELIAFFTSDDPRQRAEAWRLVGDYHGWENLDEYPDKCTRAEIEARYTDGELK